MLRSEVNDNGEHGIAEEAGCGDCGEEFAEASVLSGLAGGLSAVQIGKRVIEKCSGTGPRLDRGPFVLGKERCRIEARRYETPRREKSGGLKSAPTQIVKEKS